MWMMPLNLHVNQKSDYDETVTCRISIYTMDHPKFILSNQMEEAISTFRVKSALSKRMAVEMI